MSRIAESYKKGSLVLLLVLAAVAGEPDYLSPGAVAADPSGRTLYVAEQTANQVAVFDLAEAMRDIYHRYSSGFHVANNVK